MGPTPANLISFVGHIIRFKSCYKADWVRQLVTDGKIQILSGDCRKAILRRMCTVKTVDVMIAIIIAITATWNRE